MAARKIYAGSVAETFVFEPEFWSLEADGLICYRPRGARFRIGCDAEDRAAEIADYYAIVSQKSVRQPRKDTEEQAREAVMAYLSLTGLWEPTRPVQWERGEQAPRVN